MSYADERVERMCFRCHVEKTYSERAFYCSKCKQAVIQASNRKAMEKFRAKEKV